jgi:hypothetical protein
MRDLELHPTLVDNYLGWLKPITYEELMAHCERTDFHAFDLMLRRPPRDPLPAMTVVIAEDGRSLRIGQSKHSARYPNEQCEVISIPKTAGHGYDSVYGAEDPGFRRLRLAGDFSDAVIKNLAICLARGQYVILLDSREPRNSSDIEQALAFLGEHPGCVAVSGEELFLPTCALAFRIMEFEEAGGFEDGWENDDLLIRFIETGTPVYSMTKADQSPLSLKMNEIPCLDPGRVRRSDLWTIRRDNSSDTDCLYGSEPGASLEFEVPAGGLLYLVFARLDWCGVVELKLGDREPLRVDLFSPRRENQWSLRAEVAGPGPWPVPVVLKIDPAKNPASNGHEVWIKRILYVSNELPDGTGQ